MSKMVFSLFSNGFFCIYFVFPDGPRSAGWREHPDQRRRFPFDAREDERGYRRPRSGSGSLEDERDSLPEWCLEDADEEAGTFDSSGAFLSLKVISGRNHYTDKWQDLTILNWLQNTNGFKGYVCQIFKSVFFFFFFLFPS